MSSTKVFFSGRWEKQHVNTDLWYLRNFRLFLWNRLSELNETYRGVRSRRPLLGLCFSGWTENKDGRFVLWLTEMCSTFPLKPLNGFQRNLIGRSQRPLQSLCSNEIWKESEKIAALADPKKVAYCTQVHDMLPYWHLGGFLGLILMNFHTLVFKSKKCVMI